MSLSAVQRTRALHIAGATGTGSGIATFASRLRGAVRRDGVDVAEMLVAPGSTFAWREVMGFAQRARERALDADLVHVELGGGTIHEFHAARLIAKAAQTPLFITVHDPPWCTWSAFGARHARDHLIVRGASRTLLGPYSRRLERDLLDQACGVFTLSRRGLQALERNTTRSLEHRSAVIPYPVAARLSPRSWSSDPRDGLLVGFFGHWYPGKGLPTLVRALGQAASDSTPIRARLWGDGWSHGGKRSARRERARILKLVQQSPARGLIETPGFLEEESLVSELGALDAVVLPYERRPASRDLTSTSAALLDVFSTGTPVVASDVRSMGEFVHDGENGLLVEPDNAAALLGALRRLRDDHDLRRALLRGARASAARSSPELAATAVTTLYRRLAGGQAAKVTTTVAA